MDAEQGSGGSQGESFDNLFNKYRVALAFFIYDESSADEFIRFYNVFVEMLKKDNRLDDSFRVYIANPLIIKSDSQSTPVWPVSILDDHAIFRRGNKLECLVSSYMSCWKVYGFLVLVLVREEIVEYLRQAFCQALLSRCGRAEECKCSSSMLVQALLNKYILFISYPYLMKITCSHSDAKDQLINKLRKLQESTKRVFIVSTLCSIQHMTDISLKEYKVVRIEKKHIKDIDGRLVTWSNSVIQKLYREINMKIKNQKIGIRLFKIDITCRGEFSISLKSLDEIFDKNKEGKIIIKVEKPVERYLDACLGIYIDGEVYIKVEDDSVKKEEEKS